MNRAIGIKILAIGIIAALAVSGCGWLGTGEEPGATPVPTQTPAPTEEPEIPIPEGTLRVGAPLPATLHPLQVRYPEWISLYRLLFPSLYALDEGLKATPLLVESVEMADELHWRLVISRSFFWQDGNPVTAQDVAATLAWLLPDEEGAYPMDSPWSLPSGLIQGYSVAEDNPYVLDITLGYTAGYLPYLMTFPVLPAHIYGGTIPDMDGIVKAAPLLVGCGSFRVDTEASTDSVLVCRRTGGKEPGIARIEMTAIPGYGEGLRMVYDGELDFVNIPPNTYAGGLDPRIGVYPYYTGEYQYIALSTTAASPKKAAILEAALHVIDRKQIMNAVYFGNAALVDSPLRPDLWVYDPEYQWYDHDTDRAEEILTQAGWVDLDDDGIREDADEVIEPTPSPTPSPEDAEGEDETEEDPRTHCSLRLLVEEENDLGRQAARVIRNQLEKVGIEVQIIVLPRQSDGDIHAGYLDAVQMDQYDMALAQAYIQAVPIPDEMYVYWPQAADIPEDAQWDAWKNSLPPLGHFPYTIEQVQERFAELAGITDSEEAGEVYRKMDADGVWQSLGYSLFYRLGHVGVSPKLRGLGTLRQTDLFQGGGEWYMVQ